MTARGEFATVARVIKTQGRRGEVAVELHSSFPERFQQGMELIAFDENGAQRALKLEQIWAHKERLIFKFSGIDSISAAEELVGSELRVPLDRRVPLEPGWTFISDLAGCRVYDGNREIGVVHDVRFGAGEAPLLAVKAAQMEYEIPYAQAFLKSVDIAHKRIVMALPEGLLEVNAPLTDEEKRLQRGR